MIFGFKYIGKIQPNKATLVAMGSRPVVDTITDAEANDVANQMVADLRGEGYSNDASAIRVAAIMNKMAQANGFSPHDPPPAGVAPSRWYTQANMPSDWASIEFAKTMAAILARHGIDARRMQAMLKPPESNAKWWIGGGLLAAVVIGVIYAASKKKSRRK